MKKLFWFVVFFLAFLQIAVFVFLFLDERGTCLENGGVWDEDENRCREDCLTWNHKVGCVELSADIVKKLDLCGKDPRCHGNVLQKVIPELCQKYEGIYDETTGSCDFD